MKRCGVSAQHVDHGAALLRSSFRRKPGRESGLAGAALQLPQAALEGGGQVWITEFGDCNDVVARSGAKRVLLQHHVRVLRAGGSLGEVSGGAGRERGVAQPEWSIARCGRGRREGGRRQMPLRCGRRRVVVVGLTAGGVDVSGPSGRQARGGRCSRMMERVETTWRRRQWLQQVGRSENATTATLRRKTDDF